MQNKQNDQPKAKWPKFRYQCHGCTNDIGSYAEDEVGVTVTCPKCGKVQTTVAENYIAL